jgi:RNA polymerase sigma factor (TIGR02999 family)
MASVVSDRALLDAWQAGDASARDQLFTRVQDELRNIAAALLRRERGSSLSSGDLVNEAVLRLIRLDRMQWNDKAHFMALASRVMRQVLVDRARARLADKRFHDRVTLNTGLGADEPAVDLIDLDLALLRLEALDPERAGIVEMRYFGGMSLEEIAEVAGLSLATVKRRWRATRAWLFEALRDGPEGS